MERASPTIHSKMSGVSRIVSKQRQYVLSFCHKARIRRTTLQTDGQTGFRLPRPPTALIQHRAIKPGDNKSKLQLDQHLPQLVSMTYDLQDLGLYCSRQQPHKVLLLADNSRSTMAKLKNNIVRAKTGWHVPYIQGVIDFTVPFSAVQKQTWCRPMLNSYDRCRML